MIYTPASPIAGPTLGSADAWFAWAEGEGAQRLPELRRYLDTIYRFAPQVGLAAHVLVCQSVHETTDPETGVSWASEAWAVTLNPVGIGVTDDSKRTWHDFGQGDWAAHAHLVRVSQYVLGAVPEPLQRFQHLDPRGPVPTVIRGNRTTLGSFGHPDWRTHPTWATDAEYGEKWARTLNRLAPVFTGDQEAPPMTGYRKHQWPGLDVPVYLPDDIPVEVKIIPSSVRGWTSGTPFTGQQKLTWHDTGNSRSNANGEWSWAAGGGRADINSPGSYNGIYDPTKIIICQRFDEIVGHAGTPQGNRSWAFEQAFGNGFDGGLRIGAALFGGIIAAKGWSTDTALVQHRYWSGKWCPGQILNRGIWSQVVAMVSEAALNATRAANGGEAPPTAPIYATPFPLPELDAFKGRDEHEIPYRVNLADGTVALYVGDRVKATRATRRRRFSEGSEDIGALIQPGEEFDVDWLLVHPDRPDIYYSPWATRILAEDTERVSDVKAG